MLRALVAQAMRRIDFGAAPEGEIAAVRLDA
jgi:hypothetical protein